MAWLRVPGLTLPCAPRQGPARRRCPAFDEPRPPPSGSQQLASACAHDMPPRHIPWRKVRARHTLCRPQRLRDECVIVQTGRCLGIGSLHGWLSDGALHTHVCNLAAPRHTILARIPRKGWHWHGGHTMLIWEAGLSCHALARGIWHMRHWRTLKSTLDFHLLTVNNS